MEWRYHSSLCLDLSVYGFSNSPSDSGYAVMDGSHLNDHAPVYALAPVLASVLAPALEWSPALLSSPIPL